MRCPFFLLVYCLCCMRLCYGFIVFFLALRWRSFSSMSMYLSVMALEPWPASSLTCSLGRCLTSSDIPVCLSQWTVAACRLWLSSWKFSSSILSTAASKQVWTMLRIWRVLLIPPLPFVLQIRGSSSPGVGREVRFRWRRYLFIASSMVSLIAMVLCLLPFPTVVSHQLSSLSRWKSDIFGCQRCVVTSSEILR